ALPAMTPASIHRLLRRALQKDRSRRLDSAAAVRLEIDEAQTSPSTAATAAPGTFSRAPWLAAAAAMLIVGALAGAWTVTRGRPQQSDSRVLRLQIDPPPGGQILIGPGSTVGTVAISPDGKIVAYLARVNGKTGLWIRPLDASAASQLPGTEGASFPIWSPDSQSLAFYVGEKLQRMELGGGKPVTIANSSGAAPGGTLLRTGSWGSDGSILFPVWAFGLVRVSVTGGTPTAVTSVD